MNEPELGEVRKIDCTSMSDPDVTLRVYRWDGTQWAFLGVEHDPFPDVWCGQEPPE